MTVEIKHTFAGGKFSLNSVVMNHIKDECDANTLTVLFTIASATHGTGAGTSYFTNSQIECSRLVNAANWTGATADDRTITIPGTTTCDRVDPNDTDATTRVLGHVTLSDISALDINEKIGFELG